MVEKSEIEALIKLLDDPDKEIQHAVRVRLHELGENAVPLLDEFRSSTRDMEEKATLSSIISQLTIRALENEFLNYLENGVNTYADLEKGMFLLARFGNPTLRTELYRRKLDQMAAMIRDDIRLAIDPLDQMRILLQFIFKEERYRGNDKEYFSADNSYLNEVMDRKKGIPLSLGSIVIFIAYRLGLQFHGVNMPMHFLIRFDGDIDPYFIDPFHEGNIIRLEQCRLFLRQNGIEPLARHFEATTPLEILTRSVRNLKIVFKKTDDTFRYQEISRWEKLIETIFAGQI